MRRKENNKNILIILDTTGLHLALQSQIVFDPVPPNLRPPNFPPYERLHQIWNFQAGAFLPFLKN